LLTGTQQLIEAMGWEEKPKSKTRKQKELFIDLSHDEKIIVDLLKVKDAVHIDEINYKSNLSSSAVAAAILNLELQNVVS
jgi:DNA processing protein